MALIPMEYDGGGYEEKSVTPSARYAEITFTDKGDFVDYELVYNNDLYYALNSDLYTVTLVYISDIKAALVLGGQPVSGASYNRTYRVRRIYR